jgi:hypothetical protein
MNKLHYLVVATLLGGAAAATGCTGDAAVEVSTVPAGVGSLTLHWSIDGSFDPFACDAFAVANARVDIYDFEGVPISTTFVDCRAFSATFDLSPGRYSARIEMVDSANVERSTSVPVEPFTIVAGTNLNIDTDFPRDSFF